MFFDNPFEMGSSLIPRQARLEVYTSAHPPRSYIHHGAATLQQKGIEPSRKKEKSLAALAPALAVPSHNAVYSPVTRLRPLIFSM
jgi:hypothetical protein